MGAMNAREIACKMDTHASNLIDAWQSGDSYGRQPRRRAAGRHDARNDTY
ncbi:hypothetical protein [Paenibacillus sp. SYP-B4298]|nr:hypothetical protein [Paenibacillus sp. SYP-B4298]